MRQRRSFVCVDEGVFVFDGERVGEMGGVAGFERE